MDYFFPCGLLAPLFFALAGCSGSNSADAKAIRQCETECHRVQATQLTANEESVFDAKKSFRKTRRFDANLFNQSLQTVATLDDAKKVSVSWKGSSSNSSLVVLFIEPGQKPISALGRFRQQVRGRYQYSIEKSQFSSDDQQYEIPESFEKLSQLFGQYQPALDWIDLDTKPYFDSKTVEPFDRSSTNYHGSFVFDLFASRVPYAQFVFAEFPKLDELLTCDDADSKAEAFKKISRRFNELKSAYQKVASENGVTDVVITHTFLPSSIRRSLSEKCSILSYSSKKVVALFTKYNESVFASDSIRVFQAIWNDSNQLWTDDDWNVTCPKYANVFRVSYLSSSRSDIPPAGLPLRDQTPPSDQVGNWDKGCSEVVINSGYDEGFNTDDDQGSVANYQVTPKFPVNRKYLAAPRLGAFTEDLNHKFIMANSWATPLAAAMALHIEANFRSLYGRAPSNAELKRLLVGRVFDPILYNQFETYYER